MTVIPSAQYVLHREPARCAPGSTARRRARRPRTRGGRAPCGSARSYPTRPSNPIVCVPGIVPARVDDMSIGRLKPAADHRVAQQERGPRRRVALGGVMRLVNPRAVLRLRLHQPRSLRHHELKDVDADREVRRRDDAEAGRSAASARSFAACSTPAGRADHHGQAAARCTAGKFASSASAVEKSTATSAGAHSSRPSSTRPTISMSWPAASSSTMRPILP